MFDNGRWLMIDDWWLMMMMMMMMMMICWFDEYIVSGSLFFGTWGGLTESWWNGYQGILICALTATDPWGLGLTFIISGHTTPQASENATWTALPLLANSWCNSASIKSYVVCMSFRSHDIAWDFLAFISRCIVLLPAVTLHILKASCLAFAGGRRFVLQRQSRSQRTLMRPPKLGNIHNAVGPVGVVLKEQRLSKCPCMMLSWAWFSDVGAIGLASLFSPRQRCQSCEELRFNDLFVDVPPGKSR